MTYYTACHCTEAGKPCGCEEIPWVCRYCGAELTDDHIRDVCGPCEDDRYDGPDDDEAWSGGFAPNH